MHALRNATRVLALALLLFVTVDGAVFTWIATSSSITATGGALLLNSAHTVLDWDDVTATDMTIDVTNLLSARIVNSAFSNVAFTAVTTGASGDPVADPARQLLLTDNTFSFDGSTTFYTNAPRSWTVKIDTTLYFADPLTAALPLHLDGTSIAVTQAQPIGFAGIDDRSGNPGIADVPLIGLWIEGGVDSNTALLAHFVTHGGTHCTSLDLSVAYALSQLNHLSYGYVSPGQASPLSGDVRYNAEVCNGVSECDPCATIPSGTPPNVEIGRVGRTAVVFNPLTGLVDITITVEDVNEDAVTISTVPYTTLAGTITAAPQCMNRDVAGPDTLIHSADVTDGRFAAKGIWAVGAAYTITENTIITTVRDYTTSMGMGDLAACSGDLSTALQMTVTFYVTHTALLDDAAVRIMAQNPQEFTMFWATQFAVGIQTGNGFLNVVNPADFRLVAREPIFNSGVDNVFELEIYTPNAGNNVAQRFPGGSLTLTYDDVAGNPLCNTADGATVACQTTLTLDITDGCRTDVGVYPNNAYCYQLITIHTDQPYTFVSLPTDFDLELYDNEGNGALVSQASIFTLLQFFLSTTTIDGADPNKYSIIVDTFAGGDLVYSDRALDKPQTTDYTAGERMCFKFTIDGIDYLTDRYDKVGLDVTYGVYCALDPDNLAGITDFPAYTFNQRQVTGCNAFIPAPVQRVKFLDAFSTACRVTQTSTLTEQRFLCEDGNDLQMLDNQHVLGTCDSSDAGELNKHCLIPSQTGGLDPELAGANACSTGPGNVCSNGGDGASATPFKTNEISGVPASWDVKHCRAASPAPLTTIVECTAANAATVCAVPDECSRPVHATMLCLDAPLLTFGPSGEPAPVTFNFDVLVHLTTSTGVITSRRLLSVADPRSKAPSNAPSKALSTGRGLLTTGSTGDSKVTSIQISTKVSCPAGQQVITGSNGKNVCGIPGVATPNGITSGTTGGASLRSVSDEVVGASDFKVDVGAQEDQATDAADTTDALQGTSMLVGAAAMLLVGLAVAGVVIQRRLSNGRKNAELLNRAAEGEGGASTNADVGTP